jgi:hypothetical protein
MRNTISRRPGAHPPPARTSIRRIALRGALPILVAAVLEPGAAQACATCGCTLSADAAMGYSATAGWRLNVEFDYINQTELRSGTHAAAGVPDGNELEHDTLSRYLTTAVSFSPNSVWTYTLSVPYVERAHSTYGTVDSTQPLPALSTSRSSSLGDVRLLGSYQGFLPTHNLGVQLGIKLPTGRYGTAIDFNGGPAAGTPLDASLQPGTGSTDLIVGAYYYRAISQNFDFVAGGQFQIAVTHHLDQPGADYRPGNSTTVSLGLRFERDPRRVPQLQLNLLRKSRDQGVLADTASTAGNVAYLSPGVTVMAVSHLHLFAFAQVPVYSNLYGYQLFPRWTASVGASYAF